MTAAALSPALVALDWGTSSLRAYLLAADGSSLDRRASPHGIQNLPTPGGAAGFEQAFTAIAGTWLAANPALPVVAGGMVGSAQGWTEAPYVPCPAGPADLAAAAVVALTADGHRILIAPGVLDAAADAPDVMRGEEIQIAGALAADPSWSAAARIVLPGTHSKWVEVVDGRIVRLKTFMTGEMFAILKQHSILGRLMPSAADTATPEARAATFAAGVRAGYATDTALTHGLFAVRTLGLMKRLPNAVLEDYLSGLLIGHELDGALPATVTADARPLILIGDEKLTRRYADALALIGAPVTATLDNTAPAGLYRFARAAGLVREDIHV